MVIKTTYFTIFLYHNTKKVVKSFGYFVIIYYICNNILNNNILD